MKIIHFPFGEDTKTKRLEALFQIELERAWLEFRAKRRELEDFHDPAIQDLGKELLQMGKRMGLEFKEPFPGDYKSSEEKREGDHEVRTFSMLIYKNSEIYVMMFTSFPHTYSGFCLHQPPRVRLKTRW